VYKNKKPGKQEPAQAQEKHVTHTTE